VSGGYDGSIGIWLFMDHGHTELSPLLHETLKAAHGVDPRTRQPHEVLCVCFHKLSQLIISGGNDNKVRCWCASDRQERLTLSGHEDAVTSVCVAPDDGYLFSGSDDGHIMVWDLGTKRMVDGPRSAISPLVVLSGNVALRGLIVIPTCPPLLVSATADSIVKVWDYSTPRASGPKIVSRASEEAEEFVSVSNGSQTDEDDNFSLGSKLQSVAPVIMRNQESEEEMKDDVVDGTFTIREMHKISVDDSVSEPSSLGYLEAPMPPVGTYFESEFDSESIINIDVLIGMTSGTVIRINLPTKLSRGGF